MSLAPESKPFEPPSPLVRSSAKRPVSQAVGMADVLPGHVLILGRKRSGKTTLASALLARRSRVLVVDPHREYSRMGVTVEVRSPEALQRAMHQSEGHWRFSYFSDMLAVEHKGSELEEFSFLCRAAYEIGDCTFCVEEAHWFCDPWRIPLDFEHLIKNSGHAGEGERPVELVIVSQQPANIHSLCRSEASELYCFTIQEPNHVDWLRKYVSPDFAERARTLPPRVRLWQDLVDRAQPFEEGQGLRGN
jgi:hypothetical protein